MPWGLNLGEPAGGPRRPPSGGRVGWGLNVDPEPTSDVVRPSLWERLKSYQQSRLPSFGLAMARNITSLPNIPRDLAEMSQSVATALTPGFMKPFVERRYEGHKSLIDTLTPDALSESGDVWSTAADAAQAIKGSRGRAAGIPGWGLALENLAEEGTALALDPLELAPGGMLLGATRVASRGARGARKAAGVVSEAADLAKALRPSGPDLPGKPGFFRRWFTSTGKYAAAGDLEKPLDALERSAQGFEKAERWEMLQNVKELERASGSLRTALRKVDPKADRQLPKRLANKYLEADPAVKRAMEAHMPEAVVSALRNLRSHMDALAQRAIETPGLLADDLAEVYGKNVGTHLTRGYEAFSDPNYVDRVKGTQAWDDALEWMANQKRYKDYSPAEREGALQQFVRRGSDAFGVRQRAGVPKLEGALGAGRKDLPEVLQRVLGRIDDPEYRYIRTVERLAPDIATQDLLSSMLEVGKGKIFFRRATGNASVPVPGGSPRNPISEYHTTPEMAEVVSGITKIRGREPGLLSWMTEKYLAANSLVKGGFTAGSPSTHARNELSWGLISLSTGNGLAIKNALKAVKAAGGKLDVAGIAPALGMEASEAKSLWKHALQYGVVGQSVRGGHLGEYGRWVGEGFVPRSPKNALSRAGSAVGEAGKKVIGAGEWLYNLEDDIPKLALWMEEIKKYRKALPNASTEEIYRLTADNVRATTPTWDLVPQGVREISRFPVLGMFPGFQEEMVRNTKNIIQLAMREIRSGNPELARIGKQRLVGLGTSLVLPEAVASATAAASGVTAEQIRTRRETQAPWDRNATMAYLPPGEGEDVRQLNMGFIDPRAGLKKPVFGMIAEALAGTSPAGVAMEMGREVVEPYLGTEALVQGVGEAVQGRTVEGVPVGNPEASPLAQAGSRLGHALVAGSPGLFRQGRNIYRAHSGKRSSVGTTRKPWQEWLALGGIRVSDKNLGAEALYPAWEFGERRGNVRSLFTGDIKQAMRKMQPIDEEMQLQSYGEAQSRWENVWQDLQQKYEAWNNEGRGAEFLQALDQEGGFPRELVVALAQGQPAPPVVSPEDAERTVANQLDRWRNIR